MWLLFLIEYLYSNGIQFGVAPRTKYQKNICLEEIELCGQNLIIVISIIVTKTLNYIKDGYLHLITSTLS
jgi:hypothetical protein